MFYVDNNNFCMLKNTKELNSERYLRRSLFIIKLQSGKQLYNKKTPLLIPFTVKFFRIFQHTEVVAANVKHKFHLVILPR